MFFVDGGYLCFRWGVGVGCIGSATVGGVSNRKFSYGESHRKRAKRAAKAARAKASWQAFNNLDTEYRSSDGAHTGQVYKTENGREWVAFCDCGWGRYTYPDGSFRRWSVTFQHRAQAFRALTAHLAGNRLVLSQTARARQARNSTET